MKNKIPLPKQYYKVYCRCFTYNQSKYIEDTLNGFAMQETNFPFACMVVDDCSSDGEQNIINAWLNRECNMESAEYYEDGTVYFIQVPHRSNTNCTFAVYFLKENLYKQKERKMAYVKPWREHCIYEAVCEGDDYWIAANKLQMQTDYLELHTNFSMIFHAVNYEYPNGVQVEIHRYQDDNDDCNIADLISIGGDYAKLNTMMYRLGSFAEGYSIWTQNCPVGDLPMQLTLFVNGKVAYINDVMSCYRISAESSWSKEQEHNSKKRKRLHEGILKMWEDFDNWTNRHYHKLVRRKMIKNKFFYFRSSIFYTIKKIFRK